MDTKELLKTTPESLAEKQYKAILYEIQETLERMISNLRKGDFSAAMKMLFDSPAGDGHGCENMCINFSHVIEPDAMGCQTDIGQLIDRLRELDKLMILQKANSKVVRR